MKINFHFLLYFSSVIVESKPTYLRWHQVCPKRCDDKKHVMIALWCNKQHIQYFTQGLLSLWYVYFMFVAICCINPFLTLTLRWISIPRIGWRHSVARIECILSLVDRTGRSKTINDRAKLEQSGKWTYNNILTLRQSPSFFSAFFLFVCIKPLWHDVLMAVMILVWLVMMTMMTQAAKDQWLWWHLKTKVQHKIGHQSRACWQF